jgi:hypothetical protein
VTMYILRTCGSNILFDIYFTNMGNPVIKLLWKQASFPIVSIVDLGQDHIKYKFSFQKSGTNF